MNFGSKKTWPLNRVPMVFLQSLLFSDGLVTDLLQQQNVKSFLSWSQNAPISTIIYEWIHVSILVMSILHIHKTYVVTQIYIELYDYLEPKWPRFLKVNPPKQGLFKPKQGSFEFQVYNMHLENLQPKILERKKMGRNCPIRTSSLCPKNSGVQNPGLMASKTRMAAQSKFSPGSPDVWEDMGAPP